jgi:PAS domain S-box-containing protein
MNPRAETDFALPSDEQLRVLRQAIKLLGSSPDFDATLACTIAACLPAIGDFGFFDAVTDDGVRRTVGAYQDPDTEALLRQVHWVRQERRDMNLCALSTGEAALHTDIDDAWYRKAAADHAHLALLRRLDFRSMISVPMRHAGELVGALTLFMGRSGRVHAVPHLELAADLAHLAAPVVVNQRLLASQQKTEAALRASEERLRLATEAGAIGIWEWDIRRDRVSWSDRMFELHGIKPQDFGGRAEDFSRTLHPDDRARAWQHIERALHGEGGFSIDLRTITADGTQRWLAASARAYRDANGAPIRLIGVSLDITERKCIEQRLRLLDALAGAWRTAGTADEVMLHTTRLTGEFLGATRCTYVDIEPEHSRATVRHDWAAQGAPPVLGTYALEAFGASTMRELRHGRPLVLADVEAELAPEAAAMFRGMGTRAVLCCPIMKHGHLAAWLGVKQDAPRRWGEDDVALVKEVAERSWTHIERLRADAALHRSEAHLSSLFQQTAAGVAEADADGYLINVNERYCHILGRSREQLIGQHIQDLTHPDDRERNIGNFTSMLRTRQPYEMEKRYLRGDGSAVWVSITVSPVRDEQSQKLISVSSVVLDISSRKCAEHKLREANRRKDEFLAMLAHELRNPLAPIKAASDLLDLYQPNDVRIREASAIIGRQTSHMAALVDDLLDVSRVTRGLITLERQALDLRLLVGEAVEQVRPLIEARGHRLEVTLSPDAALATVDRKRIVQVMGNLLNNAAKFTPDGGHIRCTIEVREQEVEFAVIDDGAGMSEDLARQAFELFVQGERTPDRAQGGLGIGLALVKSLIELHGGRVAARSAGLGQGSRFSVCLPRLSPRPRYQRYRRTNGSVLPARAACAFWSSTTMPMPRGCSAC